jgi:hypothetical protein
MDKTEQIRHNNTGRITINLIDLGESEREEKEKERVAQLIKLKS